MEELIRRAGCTIEIISKTGVRYSGTLTSYEEEKKVVKLTKATSHGTENRTAPVSIQGSTQIFEYMVFQTTKISKIKIDSKWISISKEHFPKRANQETFSKNVTIPEENYDFKTNNKKYKKERGIYENNRPSYNPSLFFDTLI